MDYKKTEEHKNFVAEMMAIKEANFKYESQLEDYFRKKVKSAGGMPIKFTSSGTNGLPDQIVFYKGFTWLVELKRPKGSLQAIQIVMHKKFANYGFDVRIVRTKEEVANFITDMLNLNNYDLYPAPLPATCDKAHN